MCGTSDTLLYLAFPLSIWLPFTQDWGHSAASEMSWHSLLCVGSGGSDLIYTRVRPIHLKPILKLQKIKYL